jgi:hypothetical protein
MTWSQDARKTQGKIQILLQHGIHLLYWLAPRHIKSLVAFDLGKSFDLWNTLVRSNIAALMIALPLEFERAISEHKIATRSKATRGGARRRFFWYENTFFLQDINYNTLLDVAEGTLYLVRMLLSPLRCSICPVVDTILLPGIYTI